MGWRLPLSPAAMRGLDGTPSFHDIEQLLASDVMFDAVPLCTPPQGRFNQAHAALKAGKHVMLEKPPGATISEVHALERLAERQGVSLYATWHSREARGSGASARTSERRAHPFGFGCVEGRCAPLAPRPAMDMGAGRAGVFDPGINALSIVTHILPEAFPHPIRPLFSGKPGCTYCRSAAHTGKESRSFELDWRQTGPQTWDICVETDKGTLYSAMAAAG